MKTNILVKGIVFGLMFCLLLTGIISVSATHSSSADLQPEWSAAGQTMDYTVTLCNNATSEDDIDEVRIYKNTDYTNFIANNKTGWYLGDYNPVKKYYPYTAINSSYYLTPGDCANFTFSATTPDDPAEVCELLWEFETRDVTQMWLSINDTTGIDSDPPVVNKTLSGGQTSGVCPPGAGDECWMTQDTVINISVCDTSDEPCNSGMDYCVWEYTVDGVYEDGDTEYNGECINFSIQFDEDSVHVLNVTCYDIAGNMVEDVETFRVDSTAPETNKTYGDPHYPPGINVGAAYPHWITTSTPITLTAADGGDICHIDNVTTYYRDFIIDELACMDELYCNPGWYGNPELDFIVYEGPFYKENESCHVIEFYSVDGLGNTESMNRQCVFVEDTPPVGNKTVGDPKVPCDVNDSSNCTFWVRDHVTEINLSCVDPEPHPVDHEEVCYKVSLDSADVTAQYCAVGLENGWCCVGSPQSVIFEEDSVHGLEYYCRDALGNANEPDLEYFRVDSVPPVINKTMMGSWLGDCPPESGSDVCYVADNGESGVNVTVHDPDPTGKGCNVGGVQCDYELWWVTDAGASLVDSGCFTDYAEIVFTEDSTHWLNITCTDALGNQVEDNEVFLVDSKPPETTKTYGEPQKVDPVCVDYCEIQCGMVIPCINFSYEQCVEDCTHSMCTWWITSDTPVNLSAVDEKVGVDTIYWRNLYFPENHEICNLSTTMYVQPTATATVSGMIPNFCYPDYYSQFVINYSELEWNEYTGSFYKDPESCHVIEYYSVDRLGNEEIMKWQCVFVDNTPPEGVKTIGEPKLSCILPNNSVTKAVGVLGDAVTLYVIADNAGDPNLLEAYNVEANGSLTYVMTYNITDIAGANGAVGTALDTVNDQLFVTFEFVGEVYIFDANNFNPIGNISTGASDLAGCFVDTNQGYLYVADRNGKNVYVYDLATHNHITTYDTGLYIYGLAFDHNNNKIYLTDGTKTVREYNTTMGLLNTYSLPNNNVGVAVDARNPSDVYLYTTTWYYSPDAFTKYRINDGTSNQSATIPDPAGIAVHPTDSYVYITSGRTYSLRAYDSATMTEIQDVPMPGTCTDLFVGAVIFVPYCGDGNLDIGEECDDGNTEDGDGCSANCQIEVPVGPDCWWVRGNVTLVTLDCVDQEPHPVEQETVCFRVSYDDPSWHYITGQYCSVYGGNMSDDDYCCVYVGDEPFEFYFMEDSVHDLEFYCVDHLGNTEETTDLEYFKVDTEPPNTTKTYVGPQYVDENGTKWIDGVTTVELSAVDGGPICAIGVNQTYWKDIRLMQPADWHYCYSNCDLWSPNLTEAFIELQNGSFWMGTECCHIIEYYSVDDLGNAEAVKWQCVFVDKTPPEIVKTYSRPYFSEEGVEWISSETNISISAYDPEPHPSGLKEISYRISLVDDENCRNQSVCLEAEGSGNWVEHTGDAVQIGEESCHLIEIKAVDNVDKESLHKQCVFVDNTPPTPNKTVGDPKTIWDGQDATFYDIADRCWNGLGDEIECWRVTLTTPISMQCVDPEPHPVDHESVCFNVEVDADDETEEYCSHYGGVYNGSGDGFCCIDYTVEDFIFLEETEHNLEYYCIDALGNKGPMDEEKFKVQGVPFEIQINKKWNLVSVPFMLIDDDIGEVLKDVEDSIESVWTYDSEHQICGEDWCVYTPDGDDSNDNLHRLIPGWGYWVLATENDSLLIGGSEMKPAVTPPIRTLFTGWNLIGYHGTDDLEGYYGPAGNGDLSYCALYSLRNVWGIPKWVTLSTYWEPDDGDEWKDFGYCDLLDPGAGYWVLMLEDSIYARSTACPEDVCSI